MMVVSYGKDGAPGNGGAGGGSTYPGDPDSDDIVYRF